MSSSDGHRYIEITIACFPGRTFVDASLCMLGLADVEKENPKRFRVHEVVIRRHTMQVQLVIADPKVDLDAEKKAAQLAFEDAIRKRYEKRVEFEKNAT